MSNGATVSLGYPDVPPDGEEFFEYGHYDQQATYVPEISISHVSYVYQTDNPVLRLPLSALKRLRKYQRAHPSEFLEGKRIDMKTTEGHKHYFMVYCLHSGGGWDYNYKLTINGKSELLWILSGPITGSRVLKIPPPDGYTMDTDAAQLPEGHNMTKCAQEIRELVDQTGTVTVRTTVSARDRYTGNPTSDIYAKCDAEKHHKWHGHYQCTTVEAAQATLERFLVMEGLQPGNADRSSPIHFRFARRKFTDSTDTYIYRGECRCGASAELCVDYNDGAWHGDSEHTIIAEFKCNARCQECIAWSKCWTGSTVREIEVSFDEFLERYGFVLNEKCF